MIIPSGPCPSKLGLRTINDPLLSFMKQLDPAHCETPPALISSYLLIVLIDVLAPLTHSPELLLFNNNLLALPQACYSYKRHVHSLTTMDSLGETVDK